MPFRGSFSANKIILSFPASFRTSCSSCTQPNSLHETLITFTELLNFEFWNKTNFGENCAHICKKWEKNITFLSKRRRSPLHKVLQHRWKFEGTENRVFGSSRVIKNPPSCKDSATYFSFCKNGLLQRNFRKLA